MVVLVIWMKANYTISSSRIFVVSLLVFLIDVLLPMFLFVVLLTLFILLCHFQYFVCSEIILWMPEININEPIACR